MRLVKALLLRRIEDLKEVVLHRLAREGRMIYRPDIPVHAKLRLLPHRHVKIGGVHVHHGFQQGVNLWHRYTPLRIVVVIVVVIVIGCCRYAPIFMPRGGAKAP